MKPIQNIVMVDDNEGEHLIAKDAIYDYNPTANMISAYDGEQALETLQQLASPPDIIFLDINMPGMGGLEFLQEYARSASPSTVVVMLTSSDQHSDRVTCLAYDFVRQYIAKPVAKHHLESLAEHFFS